MQQESRITSASPSLSATSPSFTSYSSENIADIAARVIHELNLSHDDDDDDELYSSIDQNDDDEESEFEFAVLRGEDTSSPISADEIFYNGQIKPIYPLFDTRLIYGDQNDVVLDDHKTTTTTTLRLPLRKLMSEDRESRNDSVSSSSSSEDDAELEGVPPESYCVWDPQKKKKEDAVTMKKKSNSTGLIKSGSSKRWRFKDLLPRSSSDGKDSFVFLTPNNIKRRGGEKVTATVNGKYDYNGGKKMEEMKKKSYLPYRQDLVGLFSNVNGLSRTIRPF